MKKIFLVATALITMGGISNAAKHNADSKAITAASSENKAAAPVAAAPATNTVSMAELLKENQQLKLALAKVTAEKEALENKADYQHNMHFATVSLYEAQLQKKDEDAQNQSSFAWMMHNAILKLTNALSAAK